MGWNGHAKTGKPVGAPRGRFSSDDPRAIAQRKFIHSNNAKGLCAGGAHPNDRPGKRFCSHCAARQADLRHEQRTTARAKGHCLQCKSTEIFGAHRCRRHWFQKIGLRYRLSTKFVELITLWEAQSGQCALSGVPLTAQNANLDHVVPVARGGTHDLSIRWLCKDANYMKGSLSDEHFVEMCRKIAKNGGIL